MNANDPHDLRAFAVPRSPQWPAVRKAHLDANARCAACGRFTHLEVHHVEPFHVAPEKELDPSNLLTLCDFPGASCHLHLGHFGAWAQWNPDVTKWASAYFAGKMVAKARVHETPERRGLLLSPDAPPKPESIADGLPAWAQGASREALRAWLVLPVVLVLVMLFAWATH